jgi:hypothetical protein
MKTQDSLEYLLLLSTFTPAYFLHNEISALKAVVADILLEIEQRKSLEEILLSSLEKRISHLKSELMNIQPSYSIERHFNRLERIIALEHDIEKVHLEKIHAQTATTKDLLELKKLLWHYWLLLHKKESLSFHL